MEQAMVGVTEQNELVTIDKENKIRSLKDIIGEDGILAPERNLLTFSLTGEMNRKSLFQIFKEAYKAQYGLGEYLAERSFLDKLKDITNIKWHNVSTDQLQDLVNDPEQAKSKLNQIESVKTVVGFSENKSVRLDADETLSFSMMNAESGRTVQLQFRDMDSLREALITNASLRDMMQDPASNWVLVRIKENDLNDILFQKTGFKDISDEILKRGHTVAYKLGDVTHSVEYAAARSLKVGFAESEVDFKELEKKIGISKEVLQKTGNLEKFLKGEKTDLLSIQVKNGTIMQLGEAKIRLARDSSGNCSFVVHGVRKELNIPKAIGGYHLSDADIKNLKEHGTIFKAVGMSYQNKQYNGYIGVDQQTKEVVVLPQSKININDTIKGVKITKQQKEDLENGKVVYLQGMKSPKGEFDAYVSVNPGTGNLRFTEMKPVIAQDQNLEQKNVVDMLSKKDGSIVVGHEVGLGKIEAQEQSEKRRTPKLR